MKKKILYLVAPILLITACTTSFGVGTGIGLGGGRSSVSVGTGVSTETKVKKMLEAVNNKVCYWKRVSFGKLKLDDLALGEVKEVNLEDII